VIRLFAYRKLFKSLREHRQVEAEIQKTYTALMEPGYCRPWPRLNHLEYARKNFFSTLFLSIYRSLDIPAERRMLYGMINHCLRGLVTGTDNLLDDEYKEMLPLNFPEEAIRFKSVMHILLFDRILFQTLESAATGLEQQQIQHLQRELFKALVPIGAEEAQEEGGVREILSPAEILRSVHMYKGGKLLCLAFVAPQILETRGRERLRLADQGIYSIGMALQVIDDLTDFYEDIQARNHNYLLSSIYFYGNGEEREALATALKQRNIAGPDLVSTYPESLNRVMEEAIGEALRGFSLLEQAGYWLQRHQALALIRQLFIIRGVKHLLPFFPDEEAGISKNLSQLLNTAL